METETIIIHLSLKPMRRSGRKYLIKPDGEAVSVKQPVPEQTSLQRALVRAFLWRRKIEQGEYAGIADLARTQRVAESYILRQLSLTCLSPKVIASILSNDELPCTSLCKLYDLLSKPWDEQAEFCA